MLTIGYSGWAMCRLATDPDPYDETRGVSGYMRAYAGEPDLDRVIRFQTPPFQRNHTPSIGVRVATVFLDGAEQAAHPLLGAAVDLLEKPVFEGRNGVIAEDGLEPIVPFHLVFRQADEQFSRATVPSNPESPYREFNAIDFIDDLGFIERATGIASMADVWEKRLPLLEKELSKASDDDKPAIEERIGFLRANLAAGGGVARFFPARLVWDYALRSPVSASGGAFVTLFPGFSPTDKQWRARFWIGGWDADAQSFFVGGTLDIEAMDSTPIISLSRRPERMTDIVASSST